MKWFNNLKVSKKVMIASLVFVLLIIALSVQSVNFGTHSINGFNKFYDMEFMPVRYLNRIMRNLLQIRVNMLQQYLAARADDWKEVDRRQNDTRELAKDYMDQWEKYKATLFSDEGRTLAREWEALYVKPQEMRNNFVEALYKKQFDDAGRYMGLWAEGYRDLRNKTDELINSKTAFAEQEKTDIIAEAMESRTLSLMILAFSLIISAIVTVVLSRSVSRPVKLGLAFADKIAAGDLTERIDLDQEDELGMLGKTLNKAADSLESLISNVILSSQNLAQAVDQISSGNQNLSQRTSEQASALEEIASTIEEATAAINQNADNAIEAQNLSVNSSRMAEEGGVLVNDAVMSINEINNTSKKIGEIISVINEIAFQTNLLALNAAVEAARAGEQGRGFAVVAGEVRNLAQRSGNAAKEINNLIQNSLEMIDRGTEKVNKRGDALKEIIGSINTVGGVITEIAAASNEQKAGVNQINVAVSEMDSMTQQNAALVEETASASEEMANQAQELLAMVKQFTISENLTHGLAGEKRREIHLRAAERVPAAAKKGNGATAHGRTVHDGDEIGRNLADEGFEQF
jgi:methyl-accepting chemotaxis protein